MVHHFLPVWLVINVCFVDQCGVKTLVWDLLTELPGLLIHTLWQVLALAEAPTAQNLWLTEEVSASFATHSGGSYRNVSISEGWVESWGRMGWILSGVLWGSLEVPKFRDLHGLGQTFAELLGKTPLTFEKEAPTCSTCVSLKIWWDCGDQIEQVLHIFFLSGHGIMAWEKGWHFGIFWWNKWTTSRRWMQCHSGGSGSEE